MLSEKGAYNAGSVYTPADVEDIVNYAAAVSIENASEMCAH